MGMSRSGKLNSMSFQFYRRLATMYSSLLSTG